MMSSWVPQVVGTLVSTQKAQMQKVEKVRYGKERGGGVRERAERERECDGVSRAVERVGDVAGGVR